VNNLTPSNTQKEPATVIARKRKANFATYIAMDEGQPYGICCLECRREVRTTFSCLNVYMTYAVHCWECGEELVRDDRL